MSPLDALTLILAAAGIFLAGLSIGGVIRPRPSHMGSPKHCWRCKAYTQEHYRKTGTDDPQRPPKGPGSGAGAER